MKYCVLLTKTAAHQSGKAKSGISQRAEESWIKVITPGWALVTCVSGYRLLKAEQAVHEEREAYADCSWGLITVCFSYLTPLSYAPKDGVSYAGVGEVPLSGSRWR